VVIGTILKSWIWKAGYAQLFLSILNQRHKTFMRNLKQKIHNKSLNHIGEKNAPPG
jgi:hypothetical protein